MKFNGEYMENAAMFPETMTFWGAFLNTNYGFNRGDLESGITDIVTMFFI